MTAITPAIIWFRHDLRLKDNPALNCAVKEGRAVVPVFIWSPVEEGKWSPAAASQWWLHHSLQQLMRGLEQRGSRLIVLHGPALESLRTIIKTTGAEAVYWNRRYEPCVIQRDAQVKSALLREGVHVQSFNGSLLLEPWEITNGSGHPYKVFTPFWRACTAKIALIDPLPMPRKLHAPVRWPHSLSLDDLKLLPKIDWASGMRETWTPGETGASTRLRNFLCHIEHYDHQRDIPGVKGTSMLSPHLHFGEISPRQVWHTVHRHTLRKGLTGDALNSVETLCRELGWREFAAHLLFHFPHTTDKPLRAEFATFPWRKDATSLRAWQQGMTGYPIVDAGMRQLWSTGWMHNRVRMIAASFLVKHLLMPWQQGAAWFWDTLVDADLASNTLGWQWISGCGADAAPYFRIFNPVLQGEKFDSRGEYVRRWVPELATLPDAFIHQPWSAPREVLTGAGVVLGKTYPHPIVDHAEARSRALAALVEMNANQADRTPALVKAGPS